MRQRTIVDGWIIICGIMGIAVTSVCEAARVRGGSASLIIYPPFTPPQPATNVAPGHLLFSVQGVSHWGRDVVAFLDGHRPR